MWPASWSRAATAHSSTTLGMRGARPPGRLVLELDDDLVERLVADIDGGLDATLLGEQHIAVEHVAFEALTRELVPRALAAWLEVRSNAIACDLHHEVVVLVLVNELLLAGLEAHLPHDHAVVLE